MVQVLELPRITAANSAEALPLQIEARDCTLDILLLDDNRIDLERVSRMINKIELPVRITSVQNLEKFRDALNRQVFDIAIVDFNLGNGTGLDAASMIKDHPKNIDMAILMVSGETETDIVVSAIRAGCNDYLVKSDLAVPRLKEAILTALFDSFEVRDAELDKRLNDAAHSVLKGVAGACLNEFRPVLSRMFRQVKILRTCHYADDESARSALGTLDDGCLRLWRFVSELETYADSWDRK